MSASCRQWPRRRACLIWAGVFGLFSSSAWATPPAAEMARIERLLAALASRKELKLIRNGSEYDTETGAVFLRRKLESMGGDVKTCEEFIDRIASGSSMSGQAYKVRLSDGREIPAREFLRLELARLERPPAK